MFLSPWPLVLFPSFSATKNCGKLVAIGPEIDALSAFQIEYERTITDLRDRLARAEASAAEARAEAAAAAAAAAERSESSGSAVRRGAPAGAGTAPAPAAGTAAGSGTAVSQPRYGNEILLPLTKETVREHKK